MNETALKAKVLKWLKKEFPEGFFYKVSEKFTAGIPDVIGCIAGRFIAIELKVKGGKLTKLQEFTLRKLNLAGAITGVCYSLDEIRELLKTEIFR